MNDRNAMVMRRLILLFVIICLPFIVFAKNLSPIDFGLFEAKNGFERYDALLRCHQRALEQGAGVSYKGIDSIYIEIPSSANGIPVTDYTDFHNVVLIVKNNTKDIYLFTRILPVERIQLKAHQVDKGDFSQVANLNNGNYIVVLSDETPWVDERIGYGYPHYRRDILFVHDGKAKNLAIMPYNNEWTQMVCSYRPVTLKQKKFRDLVFLRDNGSTYKTCLLHVVAEHNFLVKNIRVKTPDDNNLYGDHIFMAEDCTCFLLENVEVDGTYSQKKKYGYAFGLNNVWKHKAVRVKADGKWGVYGTNNMNDVCLKKCEINRFDIHCYGRNVTCRQSRFYDLYNSFEGTYGTVCFSRCIFDNSIPCLDGGSYNVLVPLSIIFDNCKIFFKRDRPWLVEFLKIDKEVNIRPELSVKYLPNVTIKGCYLEFAENINKGFIYKTDIVDTSVLLRGGNSYVNKTKIHQNSTLLEDYSEQININKD